MKLFDVVGPVMVGPSSSHTAGAARIGYICRKLVGEPIARAELLMHGSFLATGAGHGTLKAIVGGLLGMKPDDERIPESLELAEKSGLTLSFGAAALKDVHPNTVKLMLETVSGKRMEIIGESIGGGRINICEIDGRPANFSGDYPTLVVYNLDQPGRVAEVTSMLAGRGINIVSMNLQRSMRGGSAVMVIECDQEVPCGFVSWLDGHPGFEKVTYLCLEEKGNV